MGLSSRARAAGGRFYRFARNSRRVYRYVSEGDYRDTAVRLAELEHGSRVLAAQVEELRARIDAADPQATADVAAGVQESLRELSVELTEQANRTSEALAMLSSTTRR